MLLRVSQSYRTVSNVALNAITGVPPIDLLIEQRCGIYEEEEEKAALEAEIQEEWQTRWDEERLVAR